MKKFLIFLCIPLILFLGGCNNTTNDYTEKVKLEVKHITSTEANKTIDITFPVVGGLEDSRTLATVNNSITNYVEIQEKEFNNALGESTNSDPIVKDFNAEVTKQIKTKELDSEEPQFYDEDGNPVDKDGNPIKETATEETTTEEENTEDTSAENQDATNSGEKATTTTTPISLTMTFEVTYHKNNVLNIIMYYEKVLGKNKNYLGKQSFVFDLEKGLPISLGEIYDFEGEFPKTINADISKQIKDSGIQLYEDNSGFSGIRKDANFYLDESTDNIVIFYNALEISPEKDLTPSFQFSLKKMAPYLTAAYTEKLN